MKGRTRLSIIAIGKDHESYVREGIERFTKRLEPYAEVQWTLLSSSGGDQMRSQREEGIAILNKIQEKHLMILLDERGIAYDSPALARALRSWQLAARPIVIVIGGAYGVSAALVRRADLTVSLSKLIFPHQLVRLILLEQLYRSFSILHGGRYHHE